jgi:hypothetical protein
VEVAAEAVLLVLFQMKGARTGGLPVEVAAQVVAQEGL